jgi:hypothetical protein
VSGDSIFFAAFGCHFCHMVLFVAVWLFGVMVYWLFGVVVGISSTT